jgi:NADH dehydrogenase/NADH:ubiquinone oxidoreductase subunit G
MIEPDYDIFIVYQGHHIDEIACQATLVLPTGTYLHKSGYYINYQGDLLYTINILNSSEEKTQTDIDIFFAF